MFWSKAMQDIEKLASFLVHPLTKKPLSLKGEFLVGEKSRRYAITNSIPRFVSKISDSGQEQVQKVFGYKWTRQDWGHEKKSRDFYARWVRESFHCPSDETFFKLFKRDHHILDAGCGSGFISSYLAPNLRHPLIFNVDISSSIDVALKNSKGIPNAFFVQADINQLPFVYELFDTIISLGVLHHTPDTFQSLSNLVPHLKKGGRLFLYIYKKKSPIREFTDDFLREYISTLPAERAWEEAAKLTKLGKYLSGLKLTLSIPEDMPLLGFKKGRIDLQRFFYWNILKCFWNAEMSFDNNVTINFDWYYPKYGHRHTEHEIRHWLIKLNLSLEMINDVESGFYIIARK
jgi:arsenite methyltransferase